MSDSFTLLELVLVIAIIVVIAGALVPVVKQFTVDVKRNQTMQDADTLSGIMETLHADTGRWPGWNNIWGDLGRWNDGQTGLVATDGRFDNWKGPYITEVPVDPWGNAYYYDGPPRGGVLEIGPGQSAICSAGPDGILDWSSFNRPDRTAQGDDVCRYLQ